MKVKVMFLVHKAIRDFQWGMTTYDSELFATLHIDTDIGQVDIHNVYNWRKTLDISHCVTSCLRSSMASSIIAGDFNLHHTSWAGDDFALTPEPAAIELDDAMTDYGMRLLNTRGLPTYYGAGDGEDHRTVIDLAFAGRTIAEHDPQWSIADIPAFRTDHRVTQIWLDIEPKRDHVPKLNWKLADKNEVRQAVMDLFQSFRKPKLDTAVKIEEYCSKIIDRLRKALFSTVPFTKPRTMSNNQQKLHDIDNAIEEVRCILELSPSEEIPEAEHLRIDRIVQRERRKRERSSFAETANSSNGIFRQALRGQRMCQPKVSSRLEELKVGDNSYTATNDMYRIMKETQWTVTNDVHPITIPEPRSDHCRKQHFSPQWLLDDELSQLIQGLKSGRVAGVDEIPNDLLKLTKDIILPYLEHLFQACMTMMYYPDQFKEAHTILLKKPQKGNYKIPDNWRPVALLSSVGKLLDGILAHRLSTLARKHGLLTKMQFGGVKGKCATNAVRLLLGKVYEAWGAKRIASMFGLDMEKAFNRIPPQRELKALFDCGIPDWLIRMFWSYFSKRRTSLKMPGHPDHRVFFVGIGIPQGSPVSSILLAFFTAPLMRELAQYIGERGYMVALSYVDDFYMVVYSKSARNNCRWIEDLHRIIKRWAADNGAEFNPRKYAVMHFRQHHNTKISHDLPNIDGVTKDSLVGAEGLRVLGIKLETRLRWDLHVKHVGP